jgi:hypothetical protein
MDVKMCARPAVGKQCTVTAEARAAGSLTGPDTEPSEHPGGLRRKGRLAPRP